MTKVKIITAESALEIESKVNEWLEAKKPSDVSIQFDTDGVEFPYSAFITYLL
jgi:hypothetical protein